jgi:hypothetical protein
MKTDSDLQSEILQEYEYSKPFVALVIIGAVLLGLFTLFCITAGVTAIFNLIFPNIQ